MGRYLAELPPSKTGKYERKPDADHMKIMAAVKKRPMEWLMVKDASTVSAAARFAHRVRHSKYIAFRDGKYEAKTRGTEVYVRYLGE